MTRPIGLVFGKKTNKVGFEMLRYFSRKHMQNIKKKQAHYKHNYPINKTLLRP